MNRAPVETTLYSLSQDPPRPAERRSGERHLTLFRVGSLVVSGRRELCLIKNISAGGMMLRLYCPVAPGEAVGVELKNGTSIPGKISWVKQDQAGIAFDAPIDVLEILAHDSRAPRPRMPRIETDVGVTVRLGASSHRARARDISQGGVKVQLAAELPVDAEVVISVRGFAPQPGVVRWSADGLAGLSFNRLLPLPDLVAWLQEQRQPSRAA